MKAASTTAPLTAVLLEPVNGYAVSGPTSVSLLANAAESDGTVSQIDFYANGTLVATVNTSGAAVTGRTTWNNVAPGTYTIFARATDNQGATVDSASATITVQSVTAITLPPPSANLVGAVAGSFGVSPQGAATYSLPLQLPKGAGGLTPALSLAYSSQGGYGPLGIGWSVGGLSAITRCPSTKFLDGKRGSIRLDGTDRFCLDGQRLVAVTGSYGANGTEYRTSIESFSRIVSYGGSPANGPDYFKVWTKSGLIIEYGTGPVDDIANGRIPTQGKSQVLVWAQSKVSDTQGNYYSVRYNRYADASGNFSGEYNVASIQYTANDNASGPLAAKHEVLFDYYDTPNKNVAYVMGSAVPLTKRLTSVLIKEVGDPTSTGLLSYGLYYSANDTATPISGTGNNRDRLIAVNVCKGVSSGDGSSTLLDRLRVLSFNGSDTATAFSANHASRLGASATRVRINDPKISSDSCFGKTVFDWQTSPAGTNMNQFSDAGSWVTPVVSPLWQSTGDFNGDSRTDIVRYLGSFNWEVCLAQPAGGLNCRRWNGPQIGNPTAVQVQVGDFNGDGLTDIAASDDPLLNFSGCGVDYPCNPSQVANWQVCMSNGTSGFTCNGPQSEVFYYGCDGDGNCNSGTRNVWPGPGASKVYDPNSYAGSLPQYRTLQTADLNGDGLTDFLFVSETGAVTAYLSTGYGFVARSLSAPVTTVGRPGQLTSGYVKLVDFDGDGLTDVLIHPDAATVWFACRSVLNGSTISAAGLLNNTIRLIDLSCSSFTGRNVPENDELIGDFNGDGRTDIATYAGNGQWSIGYSRGDGSFNFVSLTLNGWTAAGHDSVAADFNGDGLTDLMMYAGNSTWLVCTSPSDESQTPWNCANWSGHDGGTANSIVGDFNGDGRADIAKSVPPWGYNIRVSARSASDVITRITNAFGAQTNITYAPLTDGSVYTRDPIAAPYSTGATISNAGYPTREVIAPFLVVKQVDASNGIGGNATSTYRYAGFKADADGRGMLGFRQMQVTDQTTGIQITTVNRQDWPFLGSPAFTQTTRGILLKQENFSYAMLGAASPTSSVFPYVQQSTVDSWEYNSGVHVSTITTSNYFDNYGSSACQSTGGNCGNPTRIVVTTSGNGGTWVKSTVSTYADMVGASPTIPGLTDWILGRLLRSSVTASAPQTPTLTRTSGIRPMKRARATSRRSGLPSIAATKLAAPVPLARRG